MGICSCGSAIEVAEIDIADNLSTSAIEGTSPVVSPLSSLSAASAETLLSRTSTYMPVMSGPKVPDATLLSLIRPTVRNSKWWLLSFSVDLQFQYGCNNKFRKRQQCECLDDASSIDNSHLIFASSTSRALTWLVERYLCLEPSQTSKEKGKINFRLDALRIQVTPKLDRLGYVTKGYRIPSSYWVTWMLSASNLKLI